MDILTLTSTNYTVNFFSSSAGKAVLPSAVGTADATFLPFSFFSSSAGKAVLPSAVGTADATFIMLHCTVSLCALCPWACSFNPALESDN